MADEYIRRDAAMKAVASQYGACRSPAQNRMIDEIRNKIRRMPAADVAEVVHGQWGGLRFARGSAKGGKLMQDCCLTCKNLEYRKNYVYPYRCLKHKAERFSEKELERMYFSGEECKDFEQRRWPDGHNSGD